MAGIYHPSRGGTRGGQDQFKWEDVKDDKDREHYIGQSLMVPQGQWTKGRDIFWYTRDKQSEAEKSRAEELRKVKEVEARAMAAVLGKKTFTIEETLSKEEMKEALSRGKSDQPGAQGMGFKKSSAKTSNSKTKFGTEFEGMDGNVRTELKEQKKSSKKKKKEKKKKKDMKRERHDSESDTPDKKRTKRKNRSTSRETSNREQWSKRDRDNIPRKKSPNRNDRHDKYDKNDRREQHQKHDRYDGDEKHDRRDRNEEHDNKNEKHGNRHEKHDKRDRDEKYDRGSRSERSSTNRDRDRTSYKRSSRDDKRRDEESSRRRRRSES